jgi:hypothetical protein
LLYSKLRDAFNALDTSNSGEISMADVSFDCASFFSGPTVIELILRFQN